MARAKLTSGECFAKFSKSVFVRHGADGGRVNISYCAAIFNEKMAKSRELTVPMDDQGDDREHERSARLVALFISARVLAVGWAPYVVLGLCWVALVRSNPNEAHGELSGPIRYFLPVLLRFGMVVTVCVVSFCSGRFWWMSISKRST